MTTLAAVRLLFQLAVIAAAASLPFATALLVLRVFRQRGWVRISAPLCLPIALALGLGASAGSFTLWLVLPGNSASTLTLIEAGIFLIALRLSARHSPVPADRTARRRPDLGGLLLTVPLVVVAVEAAYVFLATTAQRPHGDWDAWAMWNSRARFFALAPDHWLDAFKVSGFFHPDYPFLLPAVVARLWTYTGHQGFLEPIVVAGLFAATTAALLFFALLHLRGATSATLATLLLLGAMSRWYGHDSFPHLAATQMADVPIGCYFLVSLVLIATAPQSNAGRIHLGLAGFALSLAAWTKNEGAAFAGVLIACFALATYFERRQHAARNTLALVAGAVPGAAAWLAFKVFIAPPGDLFSGGNVTVLAKLTSADRHWVVASTLLDNLLRFGGGAIIALAMVIVLLGPRRRSSLRRVKLPLLVISAMLLVDYLVLVASPHDPLWHATSALPRLLAQLWPGALFAAFLFARSPALAAARPGRLRQSSEAAPGRRQPALS